MKGKIYWKDIFLNLDVYVSSVIMLILIVITFLGVIFRYIVGNPFTWLEEVQLMCMVWIGFLSAGAAFRTGSHIAIEMVVDALPQTAQRVINWLIRIIVLLVLSYLFKQCIGYFLLFVKNGRLTPVLRIPYSAVYFVAPLSCALMILSYLSYEIKGLMGRKGGDN
ncbi:TRAP transporter small permease subunit [Clostridium sp. MCC353]|uniref:TRAP transporter small permease n=1 Tax=Clostridium sp. MCC353 TaxID=2592646 RepID=UPI001C00F593|nr:TRAP transporter small permease [Clostridium sp. MCC353]MBT9779891.1 TRAP transporter small permease subunit [Clostridium sp. MCC353]